MNITNTRPVTTRPTEVAVVTAPEVTASRLSTTACLIEATTASICSWEIFNGPVTNQFCTVSRPAVTRSARSAEPATNCSTTRVMIPATTSSPPTKTTVEASPGRQP